MANLIIGIKRFLERGVRNVVTLISNTIQYITNSGCTEGFAILCTFFVGQNKAEYFAVGISFLASFSGSNSKVAEFLQVYTMLPCVRQIRIIPYLIVVNLAMIMFNCSFYIVCPGSTFFFGCNERTADCTEIFCCI